LYFFEKYCQFFVYKGYNEKIRQIFAFPCFMCYHKKEEKLEYSWKGRNLTMIQRKQTMKRMLCILLALMLLVSMAACTDIPATSGTDLPSSNQTTGSVPPTLSQPTVPPTTVPEVPPTTLPEVPVDPEAYVLKFTLSQEDVDEYYSLLEECEELSLLGEDMEAVDASVT
jgi:hypothetical protein